jgi:hypothetical protein
MQCDLRKARRVTYSSHGLLWAERHVLRSSIQSLVHELSNGQASLKRLAGPTLQIIFLNDQFHS